MENKHSFLKGALCGALAMFIGGGAIFGGVSLGKNVAEKIRNNENNSIQSSESVLNAESKEKLKEIEKIIDEHYLRDTDTEDLEDGMYAGILAGLNDPYSTYYTEEETKELFETTSGEYIGIGAAMSQNLDTGIITVSRVYKDSPAEKAGMRSEDILYKVEGEEVTGEELDEVVADIKGEEGTEVHITVLRGEEKEEIELTAVRGKVEAQTVEFEMKEDQIGYISVSEFDSVTMGQFEQALTTLEEQDMQGLVIDLRSNPGGNLDTVCNMLELILPEGTIVSTKDRSGKEEEIRGSGKNDFDTPLAVLVNGYSASASEIFAGAVQDYKIGTIVGTTTYGKGVVQQLFPLDDGTCVKVTISEYFTPKGRNIDGKGIEPDVSVEYVRDEEDPGADNQLQTAMDVLREQ